LAVLSAIAISALCGSDQLDFSDKKSADVALLQDSAESSHTVHTASMEFTPTPDADGNGGGGGGAGGNAGDGGGQGGVLGLLGAQLFDSQTASADNGQCFANSGTGPVLSGQDAAHQPGATSTGPGTADGSGSLHAGLDKGNLGVNGENCLDQSAIVLTQSNSQLTPLANNEKGQAVATTPSGDVVQSGAPDGTPGSGHASVASSTPDIVHALDAVQQAFGDLHIGGGAVQSVALSVTSLPDAVQFSLADVLGHASSGGTFGTDSGATEPSAPTGPSTEVHNLPPSSPASIPLPSISALPPSFNQEAQSVIDAFFQETSAFKIETFGSSVLIEDTNASHFVPGHYGLETWQLQDGSTISILGVIPHSATA
jgi:hypothetical protein